MKFGEKVTKVKFEIDQELVLRDGKFVIIDKIKTPQGFYNYKIRNIKTRTIQQYGGSILNRHIENFKEEKEIKRKAKRKDKFLKELADAEIIAPYIGEGAVKEQKIKYYRSIGHLAQHSEIVAEVADKARSWFDESYCLIKNKYPEGQGYAPLAPKSNKWATEIRIRFDLPEGITSQDIVFGPEVNLVSRNSSYDYEINKNELGWYLLSLGFNLGKNHDINEIKSHIPDVYTKYFNEGLIGELNEY